jgi:prefoldin subunit 5
MKMSWYNARTIRLLAVLSLFILYSNSRNIENANVSDDGDSFITRNNDITMKMLFDVIVQLNDTVNTVVADLKLYDSTMHSMNSTMHSMNSTIHSMNSTMHSMNSTIREELKSLESTMHSMNSTMHSMNSTIREELKSLESTMHSMNSTINSRTDNIREELVEGFRNLHNSGSNSYDILHSATHYTECNDDHATAHTVTYKGKLCSITVKHLNCTFPNSLDCAGMDIRLFRGCPIDKRAINIENFVPLRTGDEASGLGYIKDYGKIHKRYWRGSLAGRFGSAFAYFEEDSYLIQSVTQIYGMSGGPTINGCGYTGMINGIQDFRNQNLSVAYAIVIPAVKITECIDHYSSLLQDTESCPETTIVEVPRYFLECKR